MLWPTVPSYMEFSKRYVKYPCMVMKQVYSRYVALIILCALHQDRHPKSLVRLRICPPKPIKKEKEKKKKNNQKKKEKKKERWPGFELGSSDSQGSESNHSSMGAQSHRTDWTQTHIHTWTFLWRANKDGGSSRGFCALVGEDGWVEWWLFCQALV